MLEVNELSLNKTLKNVFSLFLFLSHSQEDYQHLENGQSTRSFQRQTF